MVAGLIYKSICFTLFLYQGKCALGLAYELVSELQEAMSSIKEGESPNAATVIQQFARFMQDEASHLMKYPEATLQQAANYPQDLAPAKKAQVRNTLGRIPFEKLEKI